MDFFFFTKFAQKGYFRSETEKSNLCVRPWSLLTTLNFSAGADRHSAILMSLLLLVVETIIRLMQFQFKSCILGDASLFTLLIFSNFIKSLIKRDLIFNLLIEIWSVFCFCCFSCFSLFFQNITRQFILNKFKITSLSQFHAHLKAIFAVKN